MFCIAGALLGVSLLGSLGVRTLLGTGATIRETRLARTRSQLSVQLTDLRARIDRLGSSLESLGAQDESDGIGAGLAPLGVETQGVANGTPAGGPVTKPLAVTHPAGAIRALTASVDIDHLLRRARLLAFSWRDASDSLTSTYDRLASTPSILPTDGTVTSTFTRRRWHPILERSRPHWGLDIVAPGGTPILAAARGRIVSAGYRGDYGLTVDIDHGYGTITRYAHASRVLVRRGQLVERGDTIGRVGRTGLAVGSHLHYEVLVHGRPADPRTFIFKADAIPD